MLGREKEEIHDFKRTFWESNRGIREALLVQYEVGDGEESRGETGNKRGKEFRVLLPRRQRFFSKKTAWPVGKEKPKDIVA